jgi:TolB protein
MRILVLIAAVLALCGAAAGAEAQTPQQVAVRIYATTGGDVFVSEIERVIRADLSRSGRFDIVAAPEGVLNSVSSPPNFEAASGLRYGLVVQVAATSPRVLELQYRAWDFTGRTQLAGLSFRTAADNLRRIAHRVADDFAAANGGAAEFDSRIAAVGGEGASARLILVDVDGANPFYLTTPGAVAHPSLSASGQVAYVRGNGADARLEVMNLATNRRAPIGAADVVASGGVSIADDGSVIAFVTGQAEPNITLYDVRRASLTPLSIEGPQAEPTVLMNGSAVAFLSGQQGERSIMIASVGGAPTTVGEPGAYLHLAWSRDGRHFALVRQSVNGMELCVMPADGGAPLRVLVTAPSIGRPSWSPNGSMLLFTADTGLESIDVVTLHRSRIALPFGVVAQPSWSGLLN